MDNLANTIRLFQSGALGRSELLAQIDRLVASSPASVSALLDTLNKEHARAPLPPEVYVELERRIVQAIETRQRLDEEATSVQTWPAPPPAWPAALASSDGAPGATPERMKGVGDTLNGRFVLEECVGFGGMGTVYKALDLRKLEASDRKPYIAIKVLNVQFQGHPKSLIALQREARKAQMLAHPNIVAVYDFDRDGSMVYLTMEYLAGKALSQVLAAPGFHGMPFAEAIQIINGMGKALAYAHERGFVHCDFKPGNVILTDNGGVKVIDFGISRVFQKAEEDADVTVFDPGSLGALTPAYASPEMLENREPDPRDDIYALGCITYELLTGYHPFNRLSATQARAAGLRPQRPPGLGYRQWRALKGALAFDRNARTPAVTRFLQELGAQPVRWRPAALAASAGALLVALAVVAVRLFQSRAGPQPSPPAVAARAPPTAAPAPAPRPPGGDSAAARHPNPAPPPALPALAPSSVTAALAKVPCSALLPAVRGHTVQLEGFLWRRYGQARLKDMLAELPGVASVELALHEVDDNKCPLLGVLGPYWTAHRMARGTATIGLNAASGAGGNQLVEGDTLMVDVATPDYQSFVTVDYFVLDGTVVHLLPNLRARENQAPPRYTATIGSLGNWVIGKPFGNEMLVLLATPVPLFGALRPESEAANDYLRSLDRRLAQISKKNGPGSIAVDFLQISTKAKR